MSRMVSAASPAGGWGFSGTPAPAGGAATGGASRTGLTFGLELLELLLCWLKELAWPLAVSEEDPSEFLPLVPIREPGAETGGSSPELNEAVAEAEALDPDP